MALGGPLPPDPSGGGPGGGQWRARPDKAHVCPAARGCLLGFPGGGGGCGRSCPAARLQAASVPGLALPRPPAVPPPCPQLAPPRPALGRQGPPAPPSRCALSPWRGDSRKEARPGWAFIPGPHKEGRGDPLAPSPGPGAASPLPRRPLRGGGKMQPSRWQILTEQWRQGGLG